MLPEVDERIERGERARLGSVKRAIERGGLPTEAEILEAGEAIRNAYDAVEALRVRVDGIAELENSYDDDPTYPVTLEQIGLLAAFTVDLLDLEIPQLQDEADRLRRAIGPLGAIRRRQQGGA